MEGHCLTGQNTQWAVVPMEQEEEEKEYDIHICAFILGFKVLYSNAWE